MTPSYRHPVAGRELPTRAAPASPAHPGAARRRTLWEEGRHPGHLVVRAAVLVLALAAALEVLLRGRLGVGFDVTFVAVCLGAALGVRPRDFFTVGVLPPLLLLAAVGTLAVLDRGAVARPRDGLLQAVVSGLAHHALALVLGYGLALAVLGLRQVALRHDGSLRAHPPAPATPIAGTGLPSAASGRRGTHVPAQLGGQGEGQ